MRRGAFSFPFPLELDDSVYEIHKRIVRAGHELYLVGGYVRDSLLGRRGGDIDFATDAHPEQLQRLFSRTKPTGIEHGTVTVLMGQHAYEVTTYRGDGPYLEGRKPSHVRFIKELQDDLARRDFTINAMAYDLEKKVIIDFFGAREDLELCRITTIGKAKERFSEDPLRMLRGARFAAELDFTPDEACLEGMRQMAAELSRVSMERIREELSGLLLSWHPQKGLEVMVQGELLALVLPEVAMMRGVLQNNFHAYDVYEHSLAVLVALTKYRKKLNEEDALRSDVALPLAALLHDIAKPQTRQLIPGKEGQASFFRHEQLGAEMSQTLLMRLKFSKAQIRTVIRLVREHMVHSTTDWSDATLRRWVRRVEWENIPSLLALVEADRKGRGVTPLTLKKNLEEREAHELQALEQRLVALKASEAALRIRDLKVNGRLLMETFGLKPSPQLGRILSHLLEVVIEDPKCNTREALLGVAFTGTDCTGANLTGANLKGTDLRDADLTDADLTDADLTNTNLQEIKLAENRKFPTTKLSGAKLRGLDLSGLDFTGADLTGTDLTGANLTSTNLLKAKFSSETKLDYATMNKNTHVIGKDKHDNDLIGAGIKRWGKANDCPELRWELEVSF